MDVATENKRVKAVQRYLKFNADRQKDLQEIVMLASVICNTPIALITLMDYDIQLIKSWNRHKANRNAQKLIILHACDRS